jgi:hypothetical protein
MKRIQYISLAGLGLFLLIRGVVPAMESVDTDFPNYYTSARLLVDGGDMSRLYDDSWFQIQIYKYGMNQLGKFAPFPPITVFIMTPLVLLSPDNALRVWTLFNVFLLLLAIYLVSRITNRSWLWASILVLLSGHALANNFRFGQFYLLLTVLVICGYRYWIQGEQVKSGMLLGIGAAVKYFPILFFLEFIRRREWKIVLAGALTITLLTTAGIVVLGPALHEQFLHQVLGHHLAGNIQNTYSPAFQSWNSLFRNLFVFDPLRNPKPLVDSSTAYLLSLCCVYGLVIISLVVALLQLKHRTAISSQNIQFSLLGIAGLLLLPASATYHFLLLALPVALLLDGKEWTIPQKSLGVVYGFIGFIPYHYFEQFQSRGILTVFSYPRLILMTGLFMVAIVIAWTGPSIIPQPIAQPAKMNNDSPD